MIGTECIITADIGGDFQIAQLQLALKYPQKACDLAAQPGIYGLGVAIAFAPDVCRQVVAACYQSSKLIPDRIGGLRMMLIPTPRPS